MSPADRPGPEVVHQIYVDDKVKDYILDVVWATREPERFGLANLKDAIDFGASPGRRCSCRSLPGLTPSSATGAS